MEEVPVINLTGSPVAKRCQKIKGCPKVKDKAQRGVRVRAKRQCNMPRTSWKYRRLRPLQIENHSVKLVLHTMSL